MNEKLPVGWARTSLGEICLPVPHVQPENSSDTEFTYVDIGGIDNDANRIAETKSFVGRDAPSRARQPIQKGDILFSTVRTYLRKIARVEQDYLNPLASTGFAVLRAAEGVSSQFVLFQVLSETFLQPLHALQTGSSYPAVRSSDVFAQPILLAPTREQERLSAKLDAAFSALQRADTATRRADLRLQRYRASVLHAAITGELTRAWRESTGTNSDDRMRRTFAPSAAAGREERGVDNVRYQKSVKPPLVANNLPELPERWVWATVEDVGEVRLGRQRSPQHHSGKHMRPYLRVANVFEDRLDTSDVKRMNFTPQEFEVYLLKEGDILLNEGQSLELVGRPAMYRNEIPDCCFQNTLIRFRADEALNRDYALIVFRAYLHNGQFTNIAKITTNLAHLGADRFSQMRFPVPPEAEQHQIVQEVKRRLTAGDQLAAKLEQQVVRSRATRQSLLTEAFAGRLVPQDPADEPASVLLASIRSGKEKAQKQKVKRMPKVKPTPNVSGSLDLLAVLRQNTEPMTPEELFRASGHSQESVDTFFADLRMLTATPARIVEERTAGGRVVLRAIP